MLMTAAPGLAIADVELHSSDQSKLVLKGTVIAAGFWDPDSWFGQSEEFLGANTDDWGEFGAEIGLAWEHTSGQSTFFAEFSGLYTATGGDDASGLTIGEPDSDQANIEQAHIGWRYSDPFGGLEDDTFTLSVGRQDYLIGTGVLVADGGSDGGENGGWYLGMRKAFQESVIASLKSSTLVAEGFYLQNRPRRGGTQGDLWGVNFEYTFPGNLSLGTSYMIADARDDMTGSPDIWSGRASWSGAGGLELLGEYVVENGSGIDADGWFGQVAWSFEDTTWSPWIGYRYAAFDGDNPDTAEDERFREIAYGYTDYGSWYQGEITGDYPLANGNVTSNMLRLKTTPNDSLTLNLFWYDFSLDHPESLAPNVTSDDWGQEVNLIADWAVNDNWYVIGSAGVLFPGKAAEQWVGGDDDWLNFMAYVSYSF
ncbi:MAG TPA: hypothetical protein VFG52_00990 [Xanthomonadales bacterium]|nr:hypothetical protein [Xanthomonadales bacterium]